ncbi:extracellular catalytic domain type 1 short-chain-length polyhydroxyalkanoate depolymerase [Actinomycetospora termitidis]|uniref:PHB depolymerase family esterase n=1 Tax=Actinomycetospora termitidis TaxID=3053470 RepID=A0ABT7M343_9PSEU|nr:PHB depolymerase family esterase [Actinomycetospora sp. Odt1-22]MDL5154452.1 PHB depolymerase family esterase [Actinomycetospora sp. Odt1-22]
MTAPHRARRLVEALADRMRGMPTPMPTGTGSTPAAVLEATRLTRAGRLTEAMSVLQGGSAPTMPSFPTMPSPFATMPGSFGSGARTTAGAPSGRVTRGSFTGPAGTRAYRVVAPTDPQERPPLLVMLHGGTQDAEVFAAATGMDDLAEREGFVVAYPEQARSANAMGYWNWFDPSHQGRDGEPSLIAGIVRTVAAEHGIDRRRVFVAGFSAGAAMAAVMGSAYPDLVAGVGVHSGLAAGAARDVGSAFAAMRSGAYRPAPTTVPTIVVHGADDGTVAIANAHQVVESALAGAPGCARTEERGGGGTTRSWIRERWTDRDGRVRAESWTVHGSGHAWSGGRAGGSYTDPAGPDASAAMVDFFGLGRS